MKHAQTNRPKLKQKNCFFEKTFAVSPQSKNHLMGFTSTTSTRLPISKNGEKSWKKFY